MIFADVEVPIDPQANLPASRQLGSQISVGTGTSWGAVRPTSQEQGGCTMFQQHKDPLTSDTLRLVGHKTIC